MFLAGVLWRTGSPKTKQRVWDSENVEVVQSAAKEQQRDVGENKDF